MNELKNNLYCYSSSSLAWVIAIECILTKYLQSLDECKQGQYPAAKGEMLMDHRTE